MRDIIYFQIVLHSSLLRAPHVNFSGNRMPKFAIVGAALLILASCTALEPTDTLSGTGPIDAGKSTSDNAMYQQFLAAYQIAANDDSLIAKGWARPGKAYAAAAWTPSPSVLPSNPPGADALYSPFDWESTCGQTVSQPSAPRAVPVASVVAAAPAAPAAKAVPAPVGQKIAAAHPSVAGAPAAMTTLPANSSPAGCSRQSQNARAMALRGIALADQHCEDFFRSKGYAQTNIGIVSDVAGSAGSMAASAAGLATGAAAAPSAVGLLVGLTNSSITILNKDLLFGQSNIDDVYNFVRKAEDIDKAASLPEPDPSDWNFQQARTVIVQHQNICRPPHILTLIKSAVKIAPLVSQPSACDSSTGSSRPATRGSTVTVESTPGTAGDAGAPTASASSSCTPKSTGG